MKNCGMGVEDLPDDLTPFITRISQDHISGGGFGDVWKCNYNANGASAVVAVKAFRYPEQYHDSEKINRKISREIGILAILRHNNIVPLLGTATGFGRRSELRSLVTPWIPNGTLNAYLVSNHNDLTVLDRSRMLEDVSTGLRYLHSVDIMHGDITGANILIDEGGRAKLIDFGLSTIVRPLLGQSHLAATSIHPGQIRYAAPELVLPEEVCDIPLEKTDIYSFGCVMLQILSGRPPWFETRSDNYIVIMKSQGCGPQRPDSHPTIMDSDWDIIQKCLQFRPELRPSAVEVLGFVMRRPSSSGQPACLLDDPPDGAQSGFPGAHLCHDSDDSDITEYRSNSPPPRPAHELTNVIIESRAQIPSCPSLPSLSSAGSVAVFHTACSSFNAASWPSPPILRTGQLLPKAIPESKQGLYTDYRQRPQTSEFQYKGENLAKPVRQMGFFLTWVFSVLPIKRWKAQSKTEVFHSTYQHVDVDNDERLVDLTTKVVKEFTPAIAQGSFGDVWKCTFSEKDNNVEVAVKRVRIEIQDDRFKDIVNKRLMDDFHKWKPLRHDNILTLYGFTYGFGPVPAIVSPWMSNGSLSTYLVKNYVDLSQAQKFSLLADVAAGLQYLHSHEVAHGDLTGSNVLINHDGRALLADYGLLTTCSDINGTPYYIRSNVRWAAPELVEIPDTDDAPSSPKLASDIYSFGCIAYQILSGQQPYCNIRSDHQVVVAILRGVKPKRPNIPAIEDCHWNFIEQCWVELSQRPPIADVRDLIHHYRDTMC